MRIRAVVASATAVLGLALVPSLAWQAGVGKMSPVPLWPGREAADRLPGQYIFLTREQDTVIALIPTNEMGAREETRIPLHNQFFPAIQTAVGRISDGAVRYTYRVANGPGAKDTIGIWRLTLPAEPFLVSKNSFLRGPGGEATWLGSQSYTPVFRQKELGTPGLGRCYQWMAASEKEVITGGTARDGFSFNASYLPGFTTAYVGAYELVSLPDDWPAEARRQASFLDDLTWINKTRLVVGPMFAPESNPGERAANLELGLRKWLLSGEIARESPFVEGAGKALRAVAAERPDIPPLRAAPSTERERELATALILSLGLQIPQGSARQ